MDGVKESESDCLNHLIFCLNQFGNFEKALVYSKTLYDYYKKLDPKSPNIMNSLFSMLKLINKIKKPSSAVELFHSKNEFKLELVLSIIELTITFIGENLDLSKPSQDHPQFDLYITYLLHPSNIDLLNKDFSSDYLLDEDPFNFLKHPSSESLHALYSLMDTILQKMT